jgi:hypothetical protein
LCRRRPVSPPFLWLICSANLDNADGHLITEPHITLQPHQILIGATDQSTHPQVQLLAPTTSALGRAKNPTQYRGDHAWLTSTGDASLFTVYVNLECEHKGSNERVIDRRLKCNLERNRRDPVATAGRAEAWGGGSPPSSGSAV